MATADWSWDCKEDDAFLFYWSVSLIDNVVSVSAYTETDSLYIRFINCLFIQFIHISTLF